MNGQCSRYHGDSRKRDRGRVSKKLRGEKFDVDKIKSMRCFLIDRKHILFETTGFDADIYCISGS